MILKFHAFILHVFEKSNISAKKPLTVNSRSKALNATKRVQKPNLQKKTVNGKKVVLSAREAKKIA